MNSPPKDIAAWSRYWQDGHQASCDGGVAPKALNSWHSLFSTCPPGGRVLELGCGNGALLQLARAMAVHQGLCAHFVGIDLADIRTTDSQPDLQLMGGVAMESLPFADAGFDIVFSQYALEYSDWRRSLPEMLRVLAKGGRFRLLMHCRSSRIVEHSARQREALEQVISSGLPIVLDQAMMALADAAQLPTAQSLEAARTATVRLADTLDELASRVWETEAAAIVAAALGALRAAPRAFADTSPAQALAASRELVARLEAQLARFRDIDRAALDDSDISSIIRHLSDGGAIDILRESALAPDGPGKNVETGVWISGLRGGA